MRKLLAGIIILASSLLGWSQSEVDITGSGTVSGSATVGSLDSGVSLVSIVVAPANSVQVVGAQVPFSAIGTFSDSSTLDLTSQVTWTGVGIFTTNVQNTFTCVGAGVEAIVASLSLIVGTTDLTCQSVRFTPTGPFTASQGQPFAQLLTGTGGVPPYSFSASGLPGWLVLNNTGCGASQIDCDLTGTPSSLGAYTFNVTVTDAIFNIFTASVTVNVVTVGTEDNRYCNTDGTTTVSGQLDGPANLIQKCVYNKISSTPATCIAPGCTVPILFVCPATQVDGSGHVIPNCASHTPPYYNTIQAAFNALTSCGQWVQIYSKSGFPNPTQNVYDEVLTFPSLTCGPNDPTGHGQWVWVTSFDYTSLPAPGSRISPSWVGQTSLPGRPSFPGPSTPGVYAPFINPTQATCNANFGAGCVILTVGGNGKVPSGIRFMGLEFAWTKTHTTAPGFFGAQIQSGCSTDDCPQGASFIIYDRIIQHACQDKSDVICTDAAPVGMQLVNGNSQSLINSYLYGFKTIGDNRGFLGPQDESHAISGGNIQGTCVDGPNQIVNNYIEAASQPFFWGGASSDPATPSCTDGSHSYDLEFRRNTLFRPLTYMVGPFNPENNFAGGKIFDAWVGKAGSGYVAPICAIEASPLDNGSNNATGTCTVTVAAGKIVDIQITNPGFGYAKANPKITLTDVSGSGVTLFPEDGIYIIKNDGECKHCVRVLFEGNVATHLWTGQSDEAATCWLIRATDDLTQGEDPHENCPNCKAVDVVIRYNACRGASTGISIGVQQATRGGTIAESTGFVSVHDNIFELSAMWITATGQYSSGGTLAQLTNNGQPGTQALQSIKINHNTVLHTEPSGFSQQATGASFMTLLTALCGKSGKTNTTAVWNAIIFENNIGGGGFRNISLKSNGCFSCQLSGTCTSTLTLNSKLTNLGLDPVSAGLYTRNEVTGVELLSPGTCSVQGPFTCTITNSTGTGATCGVITDKTGALTGLSLSAFGQGYSNPPSSTTLTISGGTCSVQPTGAAFTGGAGNPSPTGPWCVDHNLHITAGWPGEDPLADPTAQGDTVNSCFSPAGGGFVDVSHNSDVLYTNMNFDATNNLPVNWGGSGFSGTDDLHLQPSSPGHGTSNGDNQGRDVANGGSTLNDMGADIDLVLLYTGCTIQSGVMQCP